MAGLLHKPLTWLIGAVPLVAAVLWLTGALGSGNRAKVEARVEAGRGDAAVQSGADAVNTVGQRADAESAIDRKVTDAQGNIRTAPDGAAADRAARDGLCDVSADYC